MALKSPIIVISAGRSGSSFLHKVLAKDSQLMWISNILNHWPKRIGLNRLAVMLYQNGIGLGKIIPDESYRYWHTLHKGFTRPMRDLTADDVTETSRKRIREALNEITPDGRRLLIKITGYSRIGFLKEIFPDAKFVHLVRDGRAVGHSLMKVNFWEGWKGPHQWNLGPLTEVEQEMFDSNEKSFATLSGIYWNKCVESVESAVDRYQPDLMEIKYADFCENPVETLQALYSFSDLEWTERNQIYAESLPVVNQNSKWRADLSEIEARRLEAVCMRNNEKYGLGDRK